MANENPFLVATVGIDQTGSETKVIQSVLRVSQDRSPKFELQDRTVSKDLPNIVIVNADDMEAVERWYTYHLMHSDEADISAVMVGKEDTDEYKYFMNRPLIANRLLALLERIVTEDHGYKPTSFLTDDEDDTLAPIEIKVPDDIRVLVVDDSLPIRTQLKLALSDITDNVDFAEDGEQAMELIEKHKYTIVFLDVVLPGGIDGYKICKKVKRDPDKSDTAVVMLTSNSSPADRVKGKTAGCDTYIIKPVKREIFR